MASCPSCQHEVSILFYSFRSPAIVQNLFRSPANRIFTCGNCGAQLTMTMTSFILCQVIFIVLVIPCAIAFARLESWLLESSQVIRQFSMDYPNMTVVLLWILPTLLVTLFAYTQVSKRFVELQKVA